jgi:eukaryotic-like serine/threonine-protein kinase
MSFAGTPRFVPLRLVGAGGMGSVYLVHDRQLGHEVALKALNLSTGPDIYQLKREFRTMADLKHPNVVTLHELICEGGQWFFTMEFVDGVPFDRYLLARGGATAAAASPAGPGPSLRASPARLLETIRQLCAGVEAIHAAGFIHRDLKPTNVLVTDTGRVVIMDFGLIKPAGSHSQSSGGISGTPEYMAPEQALERPCLPAADWYAVGSMIYEVLVGHCPFEGTVLDILLRKQSEEPPAPAQLAPTVDPQLSELCLRLLERDPTRRPTGAEILERLGVARAKQPRIPSVRVTPLGLPVLNVLGREAELEALGGAWRKVRKGSLAAVMVQGSSGIGKTSLVEAFLRDLAEGVEGATAPLILRGRCHERETLPFKAFDSVVDGLSYRIAGLAADEQSYVLPDGILYLSEIFPVLRRLKLTEQQRYFLPPLRDAKELRNQAFVAFCDLLGHLARIQPVIIFLDDMQWADHDSCALLRTLMQGPRPPALLLIVNSRPVADRSPGTIGALLHEFAEQPAVATVRLGPLSAEAIRGLVDALVEGSELDAHARQHIATRVASEAGGNPFFAVELVSHFLARGRPPDDQPSASSPGPDFGLNEMILQRVDGLPEPSQRMLELVAVAGDPLPQRALAAAVGIPFGSEEWERGIAALVDGHLVSRRGRQGADVVEIYHDRIGEAVSGRLDAAASKQLHTRLAHAVEQWDRERTDMLARYWLSAEDNERAKRYVCEAAGEALTKLAFDRAAELYASAIALEQDDKERIALLRALGDCRASNGHAGLAAEAYLRAATLSEPLQSVHFHHLASGQLLRGGQIAQGLEVLQDVLAQTGLHLAVRPRRAWFNVAWRLLRLRLRGPRMVERPAAKISDRHNRLLDVLWSVNVGLGVVDILRADDFLLRFLFLALRLGDIRRVAQGFAMLASQLAALGSSHFNWALQLVAEADVLARRSGHHATIGFVALSKGVVRYFMGEWEAAATQLVSAEQYLLSHCHGVNWELSTGRSFTCFALRLAGRLREFCERFDRYVADADRTGDRYLAANLRTYQSLAWLIRDDCARASKDIEGILDGWPQDVYQVQHFFHFYARCEQALYAGRPAVAYQAFLQEIPRIARSALLKIRGLRVEYSWICGRVAVAMAESVPEAERPPILAHAQASIRFLRHGEHQTGVAMGAAIEAAARWLAPGAERAAATRALEWAIATAEAAGSPLLAEAGRRWLGEILGGKRGEEMLARSNGWMVEQGVRNPARLAYLVVPGFQARGQANADAATRTSRAEPA